MKYDVKIVTLCTCFVTLVVKNPLANVGDVRDVGSIPGLERLPQGENGNQLQYVAWRIPWTEVPGGLSPWGCKESDTIELLTLLIL